MDDRKRVLPIRNRQSEFSGLTGVRIGTVVGTDAQGRFLVECQEGPVGQVTARATTSARKHLQQSSLKGRDVLLAVNEDSACPIIIDTLDSPTDDQQEDHFSDHEALHSEDVETVRRRLLLEAEEEVVLSCGEASITLTRTGKILIKGTYVVSRSTGTNCIKGSSVRIN